VSVDHYAGAGRRWALGASLVYGPIAAELIAMSPNRLAGRRVLDAGAGTGAATAALAVAGAHPIAMDLSFDMLAWNAMSRPACAVADICALPLADGCVDDVVAAFVLNHLVDPGLGFGEMVRVTRPGGAVLAAVFSIASRSAARDQIDDVAAAAGWRPPGWYLDMKATAVPLLGSAVAMTSAAAIAGLIDPVVVERAVDVGITRPEQLVEYRFGQAQFAVWLDQIGPTGVEDVRARAIDVIRPVMQPYQPIVVFLAASVSPHRGARSQPLARPSGTRRGAT
jgi:ubiquinone/menaquinone biosynthesis C-methylase UbiE